MVSGLDFSSNQSIELQMVFFFLMGISSKTEGVKIGISIVNGGVIGTCIQ